MTEKPQPQLKIIDQPNANPTAAPRKLRYQAWTESKAQIEQHERERQEAWEAR
jgi:hypothetical protein